MPYELSLQLRDLLGAVRAFKAGERDLEALQFAVRSAEESVTEFELRALRRHLHGAEGRLELLRFTAEGDHLFREAVSVADEVAFRVRQALGIAAEE